MSTLCIHQQEYQQSEFELFNVDEQQRSAEFNLGAFSGVCFYIPSLDVWFGRFTNPDLLYGLGHNFPNYIIGKACVLDSAKTVWHTVSRNGCCSQVASFAKAIGDPYSSAYLAEPACIWRGNTIKNKVNFTYPDLARMGKKLDGYTHVASYQNGVTRMIRFFSYARSHASTHQQFCTNHIAAKYKEALHKTDVFIDYMLAAAQLNKTFPKYFNEQHLWPQYYVFKEIPKIDVIVPLHYTDTYMRNVMHIEPVHANIETQQLLTTESFDDEQLRLLHSIYEIDNKIETEYADKFYRP